MNASLVVVVIGVPLYETIDSCDEVIVCPFHIRLHADKLVVCFHFEIAWVKLSDGVSAVRTREDGCVSRCLAARSDGAEDAAGEEIAVGKRADGSDCELRFSRSTRCLDEIRSVRFYAWGVCCKTRI